MRRLISIVALSSFFIALLLAGRDACGQPLTAAQIMAHVAKLQDEAQAERTHYVYEQHVKMISRRGHTIHCEEITDFRIVPSGKSSQEHLLRLRGRYLSRHHGYLDYSAHPPTQGKVEDDPGAAAIPITDDKLEIGLLEGMRSSLLGSKSKDGIDARLFPLTSKGQAGYSFRLLGRGQLNGRNVFHVEFRPINQRVYRWKGDAWIDTASFEPVVVSTRMSRRIPFAIRTFLGTSVPGLGFTVIYAPQPDGVWFPVSFSTEFRIHLFFFFRRTIIIDAQNRDFERTHVTSRIVGTASPVSHPHLR